MAKSELETAVLGGGCFWCLEASFQLIKGVDKVVPGYTGGTREDPTYEQVSYQNTGEAEVVKVSFRPKVISYADVLDIFWAIHDPTTPNRQGNDVGPQYRSVIFYMNESQKNTAEKSIESIRQQWKNPVVTELAALQKFYEAEDYHHNYFKDHPEQAYCQLVINPKLEKLRKKFATRLK